MAASNNEETAQYVHTSSLPYLRSPLPSMPSKSPPPSVNDKKSIQVKDKQTIGTSVSLVAELCGDTLQLDAHGPLPPATGLPPALESVQFTATEHSPGAVPSGTDITIQLQTELVATANELYRKDIEVHGERRTGKAPERISVVPLPPFSKRFPKANTQELTDEDYWSSFPPHIKNFAQKMYNIAQQMVQSDAVLKTGFSATEATTITARASKDAPGCPPGAYPSLPFDPSIFSDPEFTLSVDRATAALGTALPSPGQSHRGPPEFGQEDFIEDDYSEDAVDGDVEDQDLNENDSDLQPHSTSVPHAPHFHGSLPATFAQVVLSYEETVLRSGPLSTDFRTKLSMPAMPMPAAPVEELVFHKKNKKVSSMKMPAVSAESPVLSGQGVGTAGTAPGSALEKGSGGTGGELRKRSLPLTANAMPAARAATKENISSNPPPSSRAQGKQPMSYAPPTTTATTTTTTPTTATATVNGQQPARTARAASKAPIPAHAYQHNHSHHHPSPPSSNASVPQKHRPPATAAPGKSSQNNSKIWSTSSTEERERIKEFWLGLGEDERRNLVKIEKDTVLRKMKEQQKHSCSCAVCGRKRHAIEEELEVLYDAYYEELEQYANYQQRYVSSGGTIPPPPGPGPFPGSVELDKNGAVIGHPQNKVSHNPPPSNRTPALTNGRKPPKHESEFDDDDGDEDEYEEEEEEEYEEDEEEEEEDEDPEEEEEEVKPRDRRNPAVRGRRPVNNTKVNGRDGLFNLGSSLTVTGPGNILTVADDLLKNDGQKFLEMMEQLAERRMQREEEAAADVEDESDEEDDEEGDEDDDDEDEEEEDDDDDDEEVMTEEQKMEEGKRMFSIFAARMFEQRVLQAFREKVAQERQMQLLRELEDEDKLTREREAKKQTQNQKKKAKKILQKQARDEERAAKAAEKAAEEAAVKAKQVAQEDAQRKKREEERARREAVRKAADEEKQRKEEERRKRVAEEKEREAERERKRKEKEEKVKQERREREEKERKAKEERDAKAAAEKAARDAARKEQQEKEERERKLAKEKEEKEKVEKERLAQQQRAGKITRPPTSPRPSGSAQRTQSNNGSSKKILNKPIPVTPTPSGSTPRPALQQPQQQPQRPILSNSQPATPVASSMQNHFPPPITPHYPVAPGMMPLPPGALSPRLPFAQPPPPFGLFGPGPSMPPPPGPPPNLAPSALPRNFGSPTPFESGFSRPLVPTIPIGPPSKVSQNPLASPTMLAPGHPRRTSIPDPGPVARPVSIAPIAPPAPIALPAPIAPPAPIARPTTGETSGSGSGSPSHRSPSPKGILGSSALLADDDEVVPPPGRRIAPGAVGQSWGTNNSPRAVVGDNRLPWGAPAPPGFGSPRPPIGPSLWGGVNPTSDWQAPTFFPNSFVNHINTSPPPHTG